MRISANLGFLWADRPLTDAIAAAAGAGFDAVECHWPYATPADETRRALARAGLPMLGLNTRPGAPGEFGLSALKGREAEARAAIDEALAYAQATGTRAVHVMAGRDGNEGTFRAALAYACDRAPAGLTLLIEPLNPFDVPGYLLTDCDHAGAILAALDRPNLKMMFDIYHVARQGQDPAAAFARHRAAIGHVQFAAVPDRGAPDHGEIDFARLLPALGWDGAFGAEYRPLGPTEASLGWLPALKAQ